VKLFSAIVRRFPRAGWTLAVALITLGAFTACGPDSGTVVEKVHFPDLSVWTTDYQGKPVWAYKPECYRFKVRTPEGKLQDTCVDWTVYQATELGQHWSKK